MFIHDVSDSDFIKVLGALPSTPAVTRAHILGAFDVIVNSDDPRDFSQKVLNSAAIEPRVTLLRFDRVP